MMHQRSALIFWPTCAKKPINITQQNGKKLKNFLIGWNVRDFTIVVAAIVASTSLEEVRNAILNIHDSVQKLSFPEHERPTAPFLTIVGLLEETNNSNNNSNNNKQQQNDNNISNDDDDDAQSDSDFKLLQQLRSSTTASVELEVDSLEHNLPRLRSLYTSSIKFDATLHLMCYQENLFDIRKAPLPFSPLVRLDNANDVNAILDGKNASRVLRGGQSVLEGPFLPSHALNVMPPLHPRHLAPRSTNTLNNNSFSLNSQQQAQALSPSSNSNSFASNTSNLGASPTSIGKNQQQQNVSSSSNNNSLGNIATATTARIEEEKVEVDIKTLDPTVPPRLRYPTAASLTDLSSCKSCLSGSAFVQYKLQQASKNEDINNTSSENVDTILGSSKVNRPIENLLVRVAASIEPCVTLLLLPFIVQLAKVSYLGAICEYKLRELSNVLALIQKKTTTCGLHPVLPHTLCGLKGERRTCLAAFAARQVIGDILLGFVVTWILAFESGRVFNFFREFAWFGLHGMHVGYFDWFHGYPAGFKLNNDLNQLLYLTTNKTMNGFVIIVSFVSQYIDIYRAAYLVLGLIMFGGASLAFSFVADCCNLATLHIRFLYHFIALFYRGMTTISNSLLLLMRGKKRNLLKNRVDDASFEFDEVVLGTMACCACAFLIPTVALYYFYLATCRTVIWVIQESLRGVAVLCCNAPIYPGFLWLTRRKQWLLTGGVVLSNFRSRNFEEKNSNNGKNTKPAAATKENQQQDKENNNNNDNNKPQKRNDKNNNVKNENNNEGSSSSDVVADVVFLPLPFMAIFREYLIVIRLLFSGILSIPRILRFIWFADASSKPIVDVPNKIFRHLTADPAHPILVRGNNNNKQ